MKPLLVALLLGLGASVSSVAAAADADATPSSAPAAGSLDGVDAFVLRQMEKRHVPGASVAVVKGGKVLLLKGYGLANVELAAPATEKTVYQLASVSKTFTATGILLLIREGKLSLDDKIGERLSDLPEAWRAVTVRQLLNHTSGIKGYTSVKDFDKLARKDFAQREILDLVAKEPLEFPSGEKWNYSNTGYFLLGMLIEQASGKPYAEFMAERIFRPLGMEQTRVNDLHAVIADRAQGYQWDGTELRNGEYVSPSQPFSAGALVSSVADLVKWDAALANHALLDQSTLDEMWTPTRLKEGEAGYGYGWQVGKANDRRMVFHGGGIPGFSTQLSRFIDDELTVIVLTNADSGNAEQIARGIAGYFVPALAEKPLEPIADTDPHTTTKLREVVEAAQRGEVDAERFTAEANAQLVPRIKQDHARLAGFGKLGGLQLLERRESDGGVQLVYRATFERETLRLMFALDKDGRIQGVGIRPEE